MMSLIRLGIKFYVYNQSEICRGIFGNYGGASRKISYNYRGHYVREVQTLNL